MLKKKKINFIINLCFFTYIIVLVIYTMIHTFVMGDFSAEKLEFMQTTNWEMKNFIVNNIFVINFYVAVKLGIKAAMKEKLSSIDFIKYKGYYRKAFASRIEFYRWFCSK